MVIDIVFLLIILLFFILGYRKGFVFEFFGIFIVILSIYLAGFLFPVAEKLFVSGDDVFVQRFKIFMYLLAAVFIILFVILNLFKKFLKLIKLKRLDNILGGLLGLLKGSLVVFVAFIVILLVSKTNENVKKATKESMSVNLISSYLYAYSEIFPGFIRDFFTTYKDENDENNLKKDILNEIENNENPKVENENNR